MEKHLFPTLGRIMGKALIVAALACPLAFTSCVGELKDSIEKLNNRVDALEKKLDSEVATLKELINGKLTVADVSTQGGVTTLTLSDGKSIKIVEGLAGASLITVIEENGVMYWAYTENGADAQFLTDANGNKVAVSEDLVPQLKVENGKWYISLDGGANWTYSGVEEKEEVVVFTAASEDGDYVYLTLADGTVVKLAKDKNVSFAPVAGKQFFAPGETKAVKMSVEGIKDYTVTEKPEGWKAVLSGNKLKVTAPEEGTGEVEGVIKVLGTVEGGSPVIAKVLVSTNPDFILSIKGKTVTFALEEKNIDNWDYAGYVFGVMKASEFTPAAACAYLKNADTNIDSVESTIDVLVGESYDPEESYVVFASNFVNPWFDQYSEDDLQYVIYEPVKITVECEVFVDDAIVSVKVSGCDGYYGGCDMQQWFSAEDLLYDLGSTWGPALQTSDYEGHAAQFGGGFSDILLPETKYVIWVVPQDPDGNYTAESVWTYEFSTPTLTAGASLGAPEATITDVQTTKISAEVKAVEGAYMTNAQIMYKEAVPESDAELVKTLMTSMTKASEGVIEVNRTYLKPGEEVVLAAVAVDKDGKFGQITKKEAKAKELEYSETMKVSVASCQVGMTSASFKLAFEGNVTKVRYCNASASDYNLDGMEEALALNSRWGIVETEISSLTDNTVELKDLSLGTQYVFFVMAVDADDNISHACKYEYAPESDIVYIRKSNDEAAWAVGLPTLSNEVWEGGWTQWNGEWYPTYAELAIDLAIPENCKKVFVWKTDPSYLAGGTELSISDKTVANGTEYTESGTLNLSMTFDSHIYMVWIDSNDQYHSYYEYIPTFPSQPEVAE